MLFAVAGWTDGFVKTLIRELFTGLLEARVVNEDWRCQYNHERPHSSLGNKSTNRFAADFAAPSGAATIINNNRAGLTLHPVH